MKNGQMLLENLGWISKIVKVSEMLVGHFEKKAKSNSHWSVTITSETANLDQSECRKINSHLEIYTK